MITSPIELRRLNDAGIVQFRALLALAREGKPADFEALRDDDHYSERVKPKLNLDAMPGTTRRDIGLYLYHLLKPLASGSDVGPDTGLFAWIALAWMDDLAPLQSDGTRKDLEQSDARWIPDFGSGRRYYKHLLVTPYQVCALYDGDVDHAMCLLSGHVAHPGDISEALAGRPILVSTRSLLSAANLLYFDPTAKKVKTGAPASARRFGKVVNQFLLTWDLAEREPQAIVDMLPTEFDAFAGRVRRKRQPSWSTRTRRTKRR